MRRETLAYLKETYKTGMRVKLISMDDCQAPPAETEGTIRYVDDMGTIHVRWDTGSGLGLVYGEDSFEIIKEGEYGI